MEDFDGLVGSEQGENVEDENLETSQSEEETNERETQPRDSDDDSSEAKKKKQASHSDSRGNQKVSAAGKRSEDTTEGEEKTQEESTSEKLTPQEVETISKKLGLPKEIKPFLNKQGELRFIVPIDGKKYVATTEEVFKGFNLNQVGYRRLQKGKELEQQAKSYIDSIKENPDRLWEIADKQGLDKYELAHKLLENYVEENNPNLSDEERQQRAAIKEAEAIKAENEQLRREKQQREYQESVSKQREDLGKELIEAMTQNGFKPWNPNEDPKEKRIKSEIMADAIGRQLLAHQSGKQLSIADAVFLSRQAWRENVLSVFDDIDDNHIVDLIPERIVKAIRKADVAKLKGGSPQPQTSEYGSKLDLEEYKEARSQKPRRQKRKQGVADYFASL